MSIQMTCGPECTGSCTPGHQALEAISFSIIDQHTWPREPLPAGPGDTRWVITTPNMPFVPRISLRERQVHARLDGRYGLDDFALHPQKFSEHLRHLSVIRRQPKNDDPFAIMWWTPTIRDWTGIPSSTFSRVGFLRSHYISAFKDCEFMLLAQIGKVSTSISSTTPLHGLVNDLYHARVRLELCPGSFREVLQGVTQFQRVFLETLACLGWYQFYEPNLLSHDYFSVDAGLMGCWTENPLVAQRLDKAGVPVWLVRSGEVVFKASHTPRGDPLDMQVSAEIVQEEYVDENGKDNPYPIIYQGPPGSSMLQAVRSPRPFYIDHPLAVAEQRERVREDPSNRTPIPHHNSQQLSVSQLKHRGGTTRNRSGSSHGTPCKHLRLREFS
jgi:hypothetical protein